MSVDEVCHPLSWFKCYVVQKESTKILCLASYDVICHCGDFFNHTSPQRYIYVYWRSYLLLVYFASQQSCGHE
jgi:hypothetical protein